MKLSTTIISAHKRIGLLTAVGVCLLIALQDVTGNDPRESPGTVTAEDAEFTRLFEVCAQRAGPDYIDARDELLALGSERLQRALEVLRTDDADWAQKLMRKILLRWVEDASECQDYHRNFKVWIKHSYRTVSGKPSVASIGGFCHRDATTHGDRESLLLERLFKYDDPPHVKVGILRVLRKVATEDSLNPLIALMKSPEGPSAQCAMSVGDISRRLGDRRAVPVLLELYRTRPRGHGTGLPEEELRALPPGPQVGLLLALRTIGGEEALRALEELQRDETHFVLSEQLTDAITSVRSRLDPK